MARNNDSVSYSGVVQVFYVGVLVEEDILRAIHCYLSHVLLGHSAEKYTWIRASHQNHIKMIQKKEYRLSNKVENRLQWKQFRYSEEKTISTWSVLCVLCTCYIRIGMRILPITNARHATRRNIKHSKEFQANTTKSLLVCICVCLCVNTNVISRPLPARYDARDGGQGDSTGYYYSVNTEAGTKSKIWIMSMGAVRMFDSLLYLLLDGFLAGWMYMRCHVYSVCFWDSCENITLEWQQLRMIWMNEWLLAVGR